MILQVVQILFVDDMLPGAIRDSFIIMRIEEIIEGRH
jgi:hypothetical protein